MQIVADLTLNAIAGTGESLTAYEAALRQACATHPPPFGMDWYGEKYRSVASDPGWLAASLIANAEKEAEGSRKLWALAGRTSDPAVSDAIRKHAIDEARHANMYIAMLNHAFPEAANDSMREALKELSPNYALHDYPEKSSTPAPDDQVLDELIQMNIGEIRTRIHQLLLRPMICAIADSEGLERVTQILDGLLRDETAHVVYTGRLIEDAVNRGNGDFVHSTMAQRLAEFNHITLTEVGELQFVGE